MGQRGFAGPGASEYWAKNRVFSLKRDEPAFERTLKAVVPCIQGKNSVFQVTATRFKLSFRELISWIKVGWVGSEYK